MNTTYKHYLSEKTFTATEVVDVSGPFTVRGKWEGENTLRVIWPNAKFADGSPVWTKVK